MLTIKTLTVYEVRTFKLVNYEAIYLKILHLLCQSDTSRDTEMYL